MTDDPKPGLRPTIPPADEPDPEDEAIAQLDVAEDDPDDDELGGEG